MAKLFVNVPNIRFLEVSMQQLMDKSKDYATAIIDYINYTDRTSKMKKVVFESAPQIDRKQSSTLMHIAKKYNSSGFCKKGWKFEYDFELKTHNLIFSKIEKELVDEKKDQFIEVVDEKKEQFIEVDPVDFEESPSISEEENPGCFKLLLRRFSDCISTERAPGYEMLSEVSEDDQEDEPVATGKQPGAAQLRVPVRPSYVKVDSDDFDDFDYAQVDIADEEYFHNNLFVKNIFKIIYYAFWTIIATVAVLLMVYFLAELSETAARIMFSVLIVFSGIGSGLGMFGAYKWDKLIEAWSTKHRADMNERNHLRGARDELRDDSANLFLHVGQLIHAPDELDNTLHALDMLMKELQKVAWKNEQLQVLLDEIGLQYDDIVQISMQNEKAQFMSTYYEVCLGDDGGLSRKQYARFLSRLSQRARKEFELNGGFDAMDINKDGVVDFGELEQMLDKINLNELPKLEGWLKKKKKTPPYSWQNRW
eukprot:303775_1